MMQNEIMVSINCITYNHENYIVDAIDSFLMQKTNFAFEILIHDDSSTDKTPEIIREYESKYPNLIKPIYQSENQYSKGTKVDRFNRERAKGKYIAICEGDDYWTDPNKLQKQVDYMEQHPECSLCVHAAHRVRPNKEKTKPHFRPSREDKIYTVGEVILGGGGLFATNSMLYPTAFSRDLPGFYQNAPVGDYPLAIYLALRGTVYYIDEFMSAYRAGVTGSWTHKMSLSSIERQVEHNDAIINMLDEINRYTEYKYNHAVNKTKKQCYFDLLLMQEMFKEAKAEELKEIYSALSGIDKTKIFIKQYFPGVARVLSKIKRMLQK